MNTMIDYKLQGINFADNLKCKFRAGLPGVEAHLKLAPDVRIDEIKQGIIPPQHNLSAILIILYPQHNSVYTVVTLRNIYNGVHSGEISFPGGRKEEGDKTFFETALREAQEEIGIVKEKMIYIGELTPYYVHPSCYLIHPFVVFCNEKPAFDLDKHEVKRIIEIDILHDLHPDKIMSKTVCTESHTSFSAPGFMVSGEFMWGASAMIINELVMILNRQPQNGMMLL